MLHTNKIKERIDDIESKIDELSPRFGNLDSPESHLEKLRNNAQEEKDKLNEFVSLLKEKQQEIASIRKDAEWGQWSANARAAQSVQRRQEEINSEIRRIKDDLDTQVDYVKEAYEILNDYVRNDSKDHIRYCQLLRLKEELEDKLQEKENENAEIDEIVKANDLDVKKASSTSFKFNKTKLMQKDWLKTLVDEFSFTLFQHENLKIAVFRNKETKEKIIVSETGVTYKAKKVNKANQEKSLKAFMEIYFKSSPFTDNENHELTSSIKGEVEKMEKMLAEKLLSENVQNNKINGKTVEEILNLPPKNNDKPEDDNDADLEHNNEEPVGGDDDWREHKYDDDQQPIETNDTVISEKEIVLQQVEDIMLPLDEKPGAVLPLQALNEIAVALNKNINAVYEHNNSLKPKPTDPTPSSRNPEAEIKTESTITRNYKY